jgi:tetratricopeptide (TPR) repeat protein
MSKGEPKGPTDLRAAAAEMSRGNQLAREGRRDDAIAALQRATVLAPGLVEAHYNLARVLHGTGRAAEAAAALQPALELPHSNAALRALVLQLAALLQQGAGRLEHALATLGDAVAAAPDKAALHHNRAVLLQRLNRPHEALAAHERAQALGAAGADVHYNHGNALQGLGRGNEAVAAYRRALAADPRHALALYDLARLRWRLGDADFDAELRALEALDAQASLAPGLRAHLLARAERHAEAAAAFEQALRHEPQAAGFHDGLGRMHSRLGHHDQALASHERAVALAPGDADLQAHHAAALLAAGRPEEALAAAERACALNPRDQHAWAQAALARRLLGNPPAQAADSAVWFDDVERLIGVFDVDPPAGSGNVAGFNTALAAELRALHHDRREPVDQTLRRGTQTLGNLFDQRHPLVDRLKARFVQAISRHLEALAVHPEAADPAHPLLSRLAAARRRGWRFTDSWSSRLSRGGHHINHVHPHGWISSAYYVSLPPSVRGDEGAGTGRHAGWIQFGQPDRDLGPSPGLSPLRLVQPRVGRLVLFPSYQWHGTVPFDDEDERLTIAFDLVPLD